MKTKNVLLRLDPSLAESLRVVADVEQRSVSDVAREALTVLVEQRRSDPVFRKRLDRMLADQERVLDLLRDDE